MGQQWTFGKKIAVGFAFSVALSAIAMAIAIFQFEGAVEEKDRLIDNDLDTELEKGAALVAQNENLIISYVLTRNEKFRSEQKLTRVEVLAQFDVILKHISAQGRSVMELVKKEVEEQQKAEELALTAVSLEANTTLEGVSSAAKAQHDRSAPVLDRLNKLAKSERELIKKAEDDSDRTATIAKWLAIVGGLAAAILAIVVVTFLVRSLTQQIGTAVQHIQSSSTELQASAGQQATAAKEQATSMSEISTTISELLATSRQIAESSQRVARIAQETSAAARTGELTVQKALESTAAIKRQVDSIVGHMLDLGKKSQQIGSILEIIDELAEQTNILSINAAIEAAGAGEAGKRFAVVADEIRKLADRVGGSSREIRSLIDDVRAAVNTTVMATESCSKTVDAGARQFSEVAAAFKHIATQVGTTTEAAREIELSTKQQTTAVEQVNLAISNVSQATKETEVGAKQTLETASLLTKLSGDLNKIIRPAA